jgi:hypothetical protein
MPSDQLNVQRTCDWLQARSWYARPVRYYDARARRNRDLLGFGDVLALKVKEPHLIVQATSWAHVPDRKRKILALRPAKLWLLTGGRIAVFGWRKRKGRLELRQEEVTLDDFD